MFARATDILDLIQSPDVSKTMNVCYVVVDFEEMFSFPDQLPASHWVCAEYLASCLNMYRASFWNDVDVRVHSPPNSPSINVSHQNGVQLAVRGGYPH